MNLRKPAFLSLLVVAAALSGCGDESDDTQTESPTSGSVGTTDQENTDRQAIDYRSVDFYYDEDDPGVNRASSERFQIIWGDGDSEGRVDEAFVRGNLQNLEQALDFYIDELGMKTATQNINEDPDSEHRRINVYVTDTGLANHEHGFAFMSSNNGRGYIIIHPDGMRLDPPSHTLVHELAHVVTMHQADRGAGGWVDNPNVGPWWESMAEWMVERYLASDYYEFAGTQYGPEARLPVDHFTNGHFFHAHGRSYYASWMLLQYLHENPDELEELGPDFVARMKQNSRRDETIYQMTDRLTPDLPINDLLGLYARRLATQDFQQRLQYQEAFNTRVDRKGVFYTRAITELQRVSDRPGWWQVPTELAPQATGFNIIPLRAQSRSVTVEFNGLADPGRGSGWRATLVSIDPNGEPTYSDVWSEGTNAITVPSGHDLLMVVMATPDDLLDANAFSGEDDMPYESSAAKARFPYEVKFTGAVPDISGSGNNAQGSPHPNGGGFVAHTAQVDPGAFIGPHAQVLDNARVDANAAVRQNGIVRGNGHIKEHGRVLQSAIVDGTEVTDTGIAKGSAYLFGNGRVSGEGTVDGDFAGDIQISRATVFGWLTSQDQADERPHADGVQMHYDFTTGNALYALDRYGVNHGLLRGQPVTSNNRLTLNGAGQYVVLPDQVLDYYSRALEVTLDWRGGDPGQTIWTLGADEDNQIALLANDNTGRVRLDITENGETQSVTTDHRLTVNQETTLRVQLHYGEATVLVNGEVQGRDSSTITPLELRNDDARRNPHRNFLGRGQLPDTGYLNAQIHRFTVYYPE